MTEREESPETESAPAAAASEADLLRHRRENLERLSSLGVEVAPFEFPIDAAITDVVRAHRERGGEELESLHVRVATAGRVLALRTAGKAGFLDLSDGRSRLQVYVRKEAVGEAGFELYRSLDLGDWLGVQGELFRTRTGELSVKAASLHFLAKSFRPLPEKFHGLRDVERRYRQRYLDLAVNPESREVFERRAAVVRFIRRFLEERGYLEVETPMMQPLAGGAAARPFVTHHQALDMDLFLRIAPELYLKRLVVGGIHRVYEINRNFRNEGISTQHNPEFTMLEFYQAFAKGSDLMRLTEEMLSGIAVEVAGGLRTPWGNETIDWTPPFRTLTMREAVLEFSRDDPRGAVAREDLDSERALLDAAARFGVEKPDRFRGKPGKLLAEVFEAVAERHLVAPTFIHEFPLEISPLSRPIAGAPQWADRFELYAGGMEIANGFSELNDPADQASRFRRQMEERAQGDMEAPPYDEDYVEALEYGLPPTAGEGVGIDRLTMLMADRHSIRDVILFPLMRPRS
ncbi:MAG TPA: lysine--tRNA ligase [Thermoanaerobaculia bacterium]|nr:lysine--tRNA ligase [Thermoanaerobaculia bacterium]